MRIGIPKELHDGERRVATTPEVAAQLQKLGFTVAVETGAGAAAIVTKPRCEVGQFLQDSSDDVVAAVRAALPASVDLHVDANDPTSFGYYEIWESDEALAAQKPALRKSSRSRSRSASV